jgi:hypothetical protein
MAEICVKAVLAVADLPRRDVNLDLIKVCLRQEVGMVEVGCVLTREVQPGGAKGS